MVGLCNYQSHFEVSLRYIFCRLLQPHDELTVLVPQLSQESATTILAQLLKAVPSRSDQRWD